MPPKKGPERSGDKFKGLTKEEKKTIEFISKMMHVVGGDTPQTRRMVEFNVEHRRLSYLMTHALTELQESDYPTYARILMLVKGDYQRFLDMINQVESFKPTFHLDANQMMDKPSDLEFSGLFTNDGFRMRAALLDWLSQNGKATKIVNLLKELQKLMPEMTGGEDDF
jgi:hypothetical protein